ncbi:MAG: DUF695 domain-containing protein [Duncaniella sp.]|nr:DUF695 domain-containing protein [Duncaniella sp.]MDE6581673.1 DUF695 domain-containing protein [Duncaniella sp.]
MAEQESNWWTAPAEADNGRLVMVSGRTDVEKFRSNPRFNIRIEVAWPYQGDASGMPDDALSRQMEQVQDALQEAFRKDPVAVLTGVFTGDDERTWVFYTLSTHIFGRKLNEALADMPLLPLKISAENDPEWLAYDEMNQCRVN